jgi:hypothetical protein
MEVYGGEEVKLHSTFDTALRHGLFNPGERGSEPFEYEAGWTPEQMWTLWRDKKLLPPPGIEPRLLGYPAPSLITIFLIIKPTRCTIYSNLFLE